MIVRFLAILLLPLMLAGCWDKKDGQQELVVGTSLDNMPFEFMRDGNPAGFDVDLAKLVAKRLNRKLVIRDLPFDGLLAALQSRQVDVAIAALTPTPERRKAVDFTISYHATDWAIICPKTTAFNSLDDMRGKTIGVQMGSSFEPYVKNEMAPALGAKVRTLNKVVDLIQDMKSGRLDFIITTKSVADAFAATDNTYQAIVITKFIPKDRYENFAMALPKGSKLTAEINAVLEELIAQGRIDELAKIWLDNQAS